VVKSETSSGPRMTRTIMVNSFHSSLLATQPPTSAHVSVLSSSSTAFLPVPKVPFPSIMAALFSLSPSSSPSSSSTPFRLSEARFPRSDPRASYCPGEREEREERDDGEDEEWARASRASQRGR
jgi:hypothetical protein